MGGPGFLERGFKFINRGSFFLIFPYESEIMWSERECRANPSEFAIAYKYTTKHDVNMPIQYAAIFIAVKMTFFR